MLINNKEKYTYNNMFNLTYRPNSFSEFIGNETQIKNLLKKYPKWPSTFLLTGPPGIGKTTLARLIAKQVKCSPINIKEIDAGHDRGIDTIRGIIKSSYNKPLIGNTKVYIFDECHGLTKEAQEALLKTTEEAPPNTYFIFCSTNPQKIIKALRARCQAGHINLQPMTYKELATLIKRICEQEGIQIEGITKEIAKLCIENADGIPRNAIMLFDKFYKYNDAQEVAKEMKNIDEVYVEKEIWDMVNALDSNNFLTFIEEFSQMKRGNYESFRITMGNIFKKKLLKALQHTDVVSIDKYRKILQIFQQPVNNELGDIELIYRFGEYYDNKRI